MTRITWSRERQQSLLGQLSGFWKGDIWDMRTSPLQTRLSAKTKQRRLRFGCKSATINGELQVCVLEEVLRRRLEKHPGTGQSSPHGEVAEQS